MGLGAFKLMERNQQLLQSGLVSPQVTDESSGEIKEFLRRFETSQVQGAQTWQPEIELIDKAPQVKAKAAAAVDLTDGKILMAKNIYEKKPIASLTKVMTALLALECGDLEHEILVSARAAKAGEAFMGLEAGERLKLIDLLYGLILSSGNDAAEAIAEGLAGRLELFVNLMNRKAAEMGLTKTVFANPTGLDENDGNTSQSCVYDLIVLTHYALTNFPKFREIVGTKEWEILKTSEHKSYLLKNTLGLEETYPGMKGIKPGNTWLAGYCLLGLAEKEGHEVLVVLLDSPSPKNEVVELFDWSFGKIGKTN